MDLKTYLKAKKEYPILLVIFFVALALRLGTAKYDHIRSLDPDIILIKTP